MKASDWSILYIISKFLLFQMVQKSLNFLRRNKGRITPEAIRKNLPQHTRLTKEVLKRTAAEDILQAAPISSGVNKRMARKKPVRSPSQKPGARTKKRKTRSRSSSPGARRTPTKKRKKSLPRSEMVACKRCGRRHRCIPQRDKSQKQKSPTSRKTKKTKKEKEKM